MEDNFYLLSYFKNNYLNKFDTLKIMNIGYSEYDYSSLFDESNWEYNILDSDNGFKEVNILVDDINYWVEVANESYDVVFSKDFFVNLKYFWLIMFQIERILKPGGFVCIIVPNAASNINSSNLNSFTRNSLKSLADYVNLNVIEVLEKDFDICLIAQKSNIAQKILVDSYETEIFKNKCEVALEKFEHKLDEFKKINNNLNNSIIEVTSSWSKDVDINLRNTLESDLNSIKKFNLELIGLFSEIKYTLFDFNSSANVYCPICQKVHNIFSPFENPFRLNAQCPNCYSLEKHRLIFLFLNNKPNLLSKKIKLLHLEPDNALYNFFKNLENIEYYSRGFTLSSTVDDIIDLENTRFSENNFDINIVEYSFFNSCDNLDNVLKELFRIVKPSEDGGFLLIPFSSFDYNDYCEINTFKNQLENIGFQVTQYKSKDIVDQKLMDIYGIASESILICEKV